MEGAFILKHCDHSLIAQPQLWINVLSPVHQPLYHIFLMQCHQGEEVIPLVFHNIWSFITIYIQTLPQYCVPPPQLDEPLPCCTLQQQFPKYPSEQWEDLLIKSMMESLGGDITYRQAG
jgi:hypothetical protein